MTDRKFDLADAKRERVPLLVGIGGASGSGKTFSALRMATGMQRVAGGDIAVIDTEARRALHYADKFKFKHLDFRAPYSSDDYRAAIEWCVGKGALTLVVDSMSHEHEGPGGLLEWHEAELDRLAGNDYAKRNRVTMLAWAKPKAARRRLINTIVQLGVNGIFCFRAKPKIKLPKRGSGEKDPIELGWMPIAGEEFVYEMTVHALLYPGCGGVPIWNPELPGEKSMTKLPAQFIETFKKTGPLDEATGEAMAKWAAGDAREPTGPAQGAVDRGAGASAPAPAQTPTGPTSKELTDLLFEIEEMATEAALRELAAEQRERAWSPEQRGTIKAAIDVQRKKLSEPAPCTHPDGFGPSEERPEPHCIHCGEPEQPGF